MFQGFFLLILKRGEDVGRSLNVIYIKTFFSVAQICQGAIHGHSVSTRVSNLRSTRGHRAKTLPPPEGIPPMHMLDEVLDISSTINKIPIHVQKDAGDQFEMGVCVWCPDTMLSFCLLE